MPDVSVVMPTYNRLAGLRRALTALAAQTYDRARFEVIVISDGSTDGTDEMLRSDPPFDVVFAGQGNAGPAAARNHGIELAGGDIVLFIDDDVIAAPQLIAEHVESHRHGGCDVVVIGPMCTPPDFEMSSWVAWEQTMLYRQYEAMRQGHYAPTPRQFYTGNASVTRGSLVAAGGFDTRFRRAEDIELAYRLEKSGHHFVFNPDAVGYHYAKRSFSSWLTNAHDYGVSDVVFAREHGHRSVGQIVREGFERRPAAVRWLTTECVARPRVASVVKTVATGAYAASRAVRSKRLTQLALSSLYNTAYYRGVADQLGGSHAFRDVVVHGQVSWS